MATSARRYTTEAATPLRNLFVEQKPSVQQGDRLYRRLSALGHVKGTVASTINEFIREGKIVGRLDLERCAKELRRYGRYQHALETMDWMEARKYKFGRREHVFCLDLIAKAKGINAAESYFSGLPPSSKVQCAYGTLLNCYCNVRMEDKALDLFSKMVEEKMVDRPLAFNNLMSMYIKLGQPERVTVLAEDMKKQNIQPSTYTYFLLLNSHSILNDIEGAERVFEEMQRENAKLCDWTTYSNLACIYAKAGYREKAEIALQNLEKIMPKKNRQAYHFLLSLYASNSDLDNVHRIWKSLKSRFSVMTNKSYLVMIQALNNLNDIKGVKKCYEEWESVCVSFDPRLAKSAIRAYLERDMVEEAKPVLEKATARSKTPCFSAWEAFMFFFLTKNQIKEALQMMETATSRVTSGNEWRPRSITVDKFNIYFKTKKDVGSAEEFYRLMKGINCVDGKVYKSLLETYVGAGKTAPDMLQRIKADGIEINSELQDLLGSVCPDLE